MPRQRLDVTGLSYCQNPKPCCKYLKVMMIIFFSAVLSAFFPRIKTYVMNSSGSFQDVEVELHNMQEQMDEMKVNVQSVTQTREQNEKKLQSIEKLLQDIKKAQATIPHHSYQANSSGKSKQSSEELSTFIKEILEKYDADKTGKTDFALETSGGSIISTRNTESYQEASPQLTIFGISLCQAANNPRAIIQPGVLPGECWAFKGSSGSVVIKLLAKVYINEISIEHISIAISPTGDIITAPKEISIWGLLNADDLEGQFFGQFFYDSNGHPLQYFSMDSTSKSYQYVEVKIHSNHGHPDYTCIYRIRVHGVLDQEQLDCGKL